MLSGARNILHQMQNILGRMWQEVVCPDLMNSPGVCLHTMRYTKRNFSQKSKSLGQDWSPGAPEYYAKLLPFRLQSLVKGCGVCYNADTVLYIDMNTVLPTW